RLRNGFQTSIHGVIAMPSYRRGRTFKARDDKGRDCEIVEYVEYMDPVYTAEGRHEHPTGYKQLRMNGRDISPVDGQPGKLWYFEGARQAFITTVDPEYLREFSR